MEGETNVLVRDTLLLVRIPFLHPLSRSRIHCCGAWQTFIFSPAGRCVTGVRSVTDMKVRCRREIPPPPLSFPLFL